MEPYKFYGFSTPQALKMCDVRSEWGKKPPICPSGAFPRDLPNRDSPTKQQDVHGFSWPVKNMLSHAIPWSLRRTNGSFWLRPPRAWSKSCHQDLVSNKHQKTGWWLGYWLTINSNQHHTKKRFLSTTEVIIWEVIKPLCHEIMTGCPDRSFNNSM